MSPKHRNDKVPVVWLQISAGQGPRECGWVVGQVAKRLLREVTVNGLRAEIVEAIAFDDRTGRGGGSSDHDTFYSIVIRLEGENAAMCAKSWVGTIKWRGESHYRPDHKRKNWYIGVQQVLLDEAEVDTLVDLAREVDVAALRAKGPGGQHVNKTNSAVRITHRRSGIQVRVDTDRSQHRNKQLALERLYGLLKADAENACREQTRARWTLHTQVQRGSPVRIFTGKYFTEEKLAIFP